MRLPRPSHCAAVIAVVALTLLVAILHFRGKRDATVSREPATSASEPATAKPVPTTAEETTPANTTAPSPAAAAPAVAKARPFKARVPTAADQPAPGAKSLPLAPDFLAKLVDAGGKTAHFALPDGRAAAGVVEMLRHDAQGVLLVQGRLTQPEGGFFFFQRQTVAGVAGALVGTVRFDKSDLAFRVDPTGPGGAPMLVTHGLDEIVCSNMPPADFTKMRPERTPKTPQSHPTNIPIPTYQNGVIPLQSLPGALGVIYLDFDGEPGPFPGWGNFDAAPSGATNAQIEDVWQRIAEDWQPFNINITTDRKVFDSAPQGSRQHCILTPTTTAAPGAGGVSYIGSFNNTGDTVNWSFYSTGKAAAEVVSHECGHALGLGHDGRISPSEGYYGGHGSGEVGWAPIMGVGYYQNLVQWSKGEYLSANNTEDDLAIIVTNNNNVDYRVDDATATFATAPYLEVLANNTVSNEGIIETSADVDAFRFTTTGGAVSFTVSTVNAGPNLDILAEIYNSANAVVATNNPDTGLSATVAATLLAGDFTLRVSGVGRADPLVDGYTDYDSLGAYLITGSAVGCVKPDRFTIAENSANGTAAGTVAPRNAHGANPLTFTIASGNGTGTGAFAISTTGGALTVADVAQMNFEALSLRWDDPATFQLFVTITDTVAPALNETVRVVIALTDLNETPTITGGSLTMLDHTRIGTKVLKVTGGDPDRFDFPTFSIVAGNTGNAFAIDAGTGQITVAADTNALVQSVYSLTVRATDQNATPLFANATVTITLVHTPTGYTPGTITRTFFENIGGGTNVTDLTGNAKFPNNPDSEVALTAFDSGTDHADNYGSTVRGYLIPPTTGSYTFWLSSDDSADLRISTNATPASAVVRATLSGYSNQYQWNKFASQQSIALTLTAGTAYYLEARQKEGGGGDHVEVAWQGPNITQQVISGLFLAPYYQNYAPKIVASTFTVRENAFNGTTVGTTQVTDVNAADTHAAFTITGGTGASVFGIDAPTGRIFLANNATLNATTTPSYTLTIQTTDNGTPAMNGSGPVTVNVLATGAVNVAGIVQQFWDNIGGNNVSALTSDPRYPNSPSSSRILTSFDSGNDFADTYGSRIRAYVVPPTTGAYTFYIASDDEGQLRLSTDATPANATQIANAANATGRNTWNANVSQTSAAFTLTAGQRYYIETLQKEGGGGDYVQIAWTGPGIATQTIIPGSALQPFDANTAPAFTGAPYSFAISASAANGSAVGTVAATDPTNDALVYAITSGNPGGAFALSAQTGAITVANSAALPVGQTVTLQIAVQDDGTGGLYPLKSATSTATVTIGTTIHLVSPTVATVQIPSGVGLALAADNAGRSGTTIAWTKFSGPGAVVFDNAAALITGATFSTTGSYVLRCAETSGAFTTSFDVTVNVGVIPVALTGTPVGAQTIAPSHTLSAGAYTISAAGVGIPSTSTPDDFYFINAPATGNVTITARVVNVPNVSGSNSRAGVMIRESLAADSREAFCGVTSINGQRFIYRATAATNSASAANNPAQTPFAPYWVRLIRTGNSFTAFIAPDVSGTPGTFVAIGAAQPLAMSSSAFVGLAATSGSTGTAGSAVIDNVTVSPPVVNVAASVSAGPDATITLPASAALDGTVTDDGRPTPPALVTTAWSKFSGPGTVTFGNVSAIDTSAAFSTTGSYLLRLTADDGEAKTYDDVALTVQLAPIEQWRNAHFGANAGNPAIAGDLADPDGDGLANLLEYALNLDPLLPGASGLVMDLETISTSQYLRLTATKNPAATDVTFSIEVTGTIGIPASWTTAGTTVENNTSTMLRVRDNNAVSAAAQRSIRLKVTRP